MSGLNPIHPPSALLTQLWLEPCSWPWQHGIDRWVYVWPATLLGCNEMMGSQGFSMTKSSKFRQPANHSFWNLPKHMYSYLLDQPTKIKECSPPKPLPVPKCCQNKLISSRPPIFIEFLYFPGNYKEHIPTIKTYLKIIFQSFRLLPMDFSWLGTRWFHQAVLTGHL